MLRLKPRRRAVLVEALRELANLVAGALVLGQFVGVAQWSFTLVLAGIAVWSVLLGLALFFAEENDDD